MGLYCSDTVVPRLGTRDVIVITQQERDETFQTSERGKVPRGAWRTVRDNQQVKG